MSRSLKLFDSYTESLNSSPEKSQAIDYDYLDDENQFNLYREDSSYGFQVTSIHLNFGESVVRDVSFVQKLMSNTEIENKKFKLSPKRETESSEAPSINANLEN